VLLENCGVALFLLRKRGSPHMKKGEPEKSAQGWRQEIRKRSFDQEERRRFQEGWEEKGRVDARVTGTHWERGRSFSKKG